MGACRQAGEHRGRIALGGRGFADGQRNFPRRHGVAGQRIHQQQNVHVLVAEVLGNGGGVVRPLHCYGLSLKEA